MNDRKVAFYIRLSVEDAKSGSLSIETQEKIISDKFKKLPEYQSSEVIKLVDNGYSGTDFTRPALTELLDLVQLGEISCIILKDFSRLGRNIAKSGKLIDTIFPMYYTRLISVTDYYDSDDYYEDTGGIEVAFKCMMAEQYSLDLSKKTKAVFDYKIKNGTYKTKNIIYGYLLNENREYVIDEAVADNIRLIFRMASEGNSVNQIRETLLQMKVPTSGEYRNSLFKSVRHHTDRTNGIWSKARILNLLRDERYIGTYVGGTYKQLEVGKQTKVRKPESEWVKIPNSHSPIVEKEMFDKVQELFPKKTVAKKKTHAYPLRGKVYCGECRHRLVLANYDKYTKYYCSSVGISSLECEKCSILQESLLSSILKFAKVQSEKILSEQEQKVATSHLEPVNPSMIDEIQREKMSLYEQFTRKEIDIEVYKSLKEELDKSLDHHTAIYQASEKENVTHKSKQIEIADNKALAKEILQAESLTIALGEKLVKKVTVYPDKTLEIVFISEMFSKPVKIGIN